jgi:ParB-like chromosome segregation protein Spo0J
LPSSLRSLPLDSLVILRRNPQYLSERQMNALVESIKRDGFLSPIVVRPRGEQWEILSGNHRALAARESGLTKVACVVIDCDDKTAARIAVNMNSVHGDPTPELLAPYLAEIDDETLRSIYIDPAMLDELLDFDATLAERLDALLAPDSLDVDSLKGAIPNCVCKCGHRHVRARKTSKSSKPARKNTRASKTS